jgi:hypothetical protein
VDEHTATQLAAAQMIDSLGAPAGFMISIRLIQVIAERTSPKTPELIAAFAGCLKGMEHFAEVAGLGRLAEEHGSDESGSGGHARNGKANGKGGSGGPLA